MRRCDTGVEPCPSPLYDVQAERWLPGATKSVDEAAGLIEVKLDMHTAAHASLFTPLSSHFTCVDR